MGFQMINVLDKHNWENKLYHKISLPNHIVTNWVIQLSCVLTAKWYVGGWTLPLVGMYIPLKDCIHPHHFIVHSLVDWKFYNNLAGNHGVANGSLVDQ